MWMGATAAMTYYFDPERGEKRRKDLRKRGQVGPQSNRRAISSA